MAARKIPMTTAQHIEHGSRLKAAHHTLAALQQDLYLAARQSDPEARAVAKALNALTKLRYALEDVALKDYPIQFGEESDWLRLYARTDREFRA
ncbi:hypothetical protein [Actinoplanes sp. HUAS TT8]|uniref:hypothetical protein n=1 Tax=Actinoplanes sp. HUAS TT8 TaxID=3447453 RepID=UPI003F523AB7